MSTPPLSPLLKIVELERTLLSKGKVRGWYERPLDDADRETARRFVNGCFNHGEFPEGCSIGWSDGKVAIQILQEGGEVLVNLICPCNPRCPPLVPARDGAEVFYRSKRPTLKRSDVEMAIAAARSQETHDKT